MRIILALVAAAFIFGGCDDVKELQETKYKNYPKVCKDYFNTFDGQMVRGKGAVGIRAVMGYCKFREEYEESN